MKFSKTKFAMYLSALLIFSACDKNKKDDSKIDTAGAKFFWSEKSIQENALIKVLNQFGEPISGAKVLVGDAQGAPFRDNFITTDNTGVAMVSRDWISEASVTVDASGYVRQTLLNQKPGNLIIKMSSAYLTERAELRGQVTQLPVVNGDKLIDFALVMPALSKADLLNFDLGQVISPYTDTLTAAGQSGDVPSNVSIPKQKESYFIGVTLDKPIYRLKMPTYGPKRIVSVRGRFVFKTMVSELQNGKAFYELINHFSILGGSIRDTVIASPLTQLDIPGNEMSFSQTVQAKPKSFAADELLLVLAANEVSNSIIPTDIKRATNGQATHLQSLPNKPAYVISVIKKQAEFMSPEPDADRMSASLLPVEQSGKALLPLVANPQMINQGQYTIVLPNISLVSGINPLATSASISDVIQTMDGEKQITITIKKWDVLGLGWNFNNQRISLPKWPLDTNQSRKRLEINFIGSTIGKSSHLDKSLIENATHVTHASTDF